MDRPAQFSPVTIEIMKAPAKKSRPAPVITDLSSPAALAEFRKAADAYTKKATRSKASALKALIDSGIYDKSGRLSRHFR
jgi:hypothetical protein